jgi:hypothetical protein
MVESGRGSKGRETCWRMGNDRCCSLSLGLLPLRSDQIPFPMSISGTKNTLEASLEPSLQALITIVSLAAQDFRCSNSKP